MILKQCPVCHERLTVKVLACSHCGLELTNNFELSPFDSLSDEDTAFLLAFLKTRGNLSALQTETGISYSAERLTLEQILQKLNLKDEIERKNMDMSIFSKKNDGSASSIIRNKLISANGVATIRTYDGTPYRIYLTKDGNGFGCDALRNVTYTFSVFDIVVDLLKREGGCARKGQARGKYDKVGSPNCDEHTVAGVIALQYYKKNIGDSVFDPVFIIAGVLEWADIAENGRGYLRLK